MAKAIDIARFFIDIANTIPTFDLMTNLRVNKLLYFAQGECLRQLNHPLFPDKIEAWSYGPVVADVYNTYKKFKREPIKEEINFDNDVLTEQERDVLFDVLRYYGNFSTGMLVSLSHKKGSPWDMVYQKDHNHTIIPNELIKQSFNTMPPIPKFTLPYKESDYIGYRDKDGYLVLPKDWDDDE